MKFPDYITIISDEVSQDLPVISAFVREFRLPGIELRSLNGRAFKDLTRSDIAEVITASRAEGWRVVGCACLPLSSKRRLGRSSVAHTAPAGG